jgi:hypothetical protein
MPNVQPEARKLIFASGEEEMLAEIAMFCIGDHSTESGIAAEIGRTFSLGFVTSSQIIVP